MRLELISKLDIPIPPLSKDYQLNYLYSPRIYGIINYLAASGRKYLEIGTYRGVSLYSAAYGNPQTVCHSIDHSRGFDSNNLWAIRTLLFGLNNAQVVKTDYPAFFSTCKSKYDVIFVDGPKNYEQMLLQLIFSSSFLAPQGLIIIADIRRSEVHEAIMEIRTLDKTIDLFFQASPTNILHSDFEKGLIVLRKTSHG